MAKHPRVQTVKGTRSDTSTIIKTQPVGFSSGSTCADVRGPKASICPSGRTHKMMVDQPLKRARIEHVRLGTAWLEQDQATGGMVGVNDGIRGPCGSASQNRLHGLDGGHHLSIGRYIVVSQGASSLQTLLSLFDGAAILDSCHFVQEPLDDLDAVPALRALAPGLQERRAVVVVHRGLDLDGRLAFDRELDPTLAAVTVPDTIVEAELHFLLDVAGKVVRRDPAGVDVKCRLSAFGVFVDQAGLHRIPRVPILGTDQATLPPALTETSRPPNVKSISLM